MLGQSGLSRSVMAKNCNKLPGADIEGNIIDRTNSAGRVSLFIALYIIMDQFTDFDHVLPVSLFDYATFDLFAFIIFKFDIFKL